MNLVMHNLRKRKNQGLRTFVVSLMLISFCAPSPATAVSMGQLQGNSGFMAMVVAISNLNIAMQQATLNPHNKAYRQRVAHAYSMMPLGIMALAKEFQSNKLHDDDFPFVQGILGGFVQKDLSSKVEDFMKDPSRQNIPSVGSQFPQGALKQAEDSYAADNKTIGVSGDKDLLDSSSNQQGSAKSSDLASGGSDIVDLSSREAQVEKSSKAIVNNTIRVNKNRALLNSSASSSEEKGRSENSFSQNSNEFKEEVSKAIQNSESSLTADIIRTTASSTEEEKDKEDNSFFKYKEKKKERAPKERKIRKGKAHKTGFLNSYPRKAIFAYLWEALVPEAGAEITGIVGAVVGAAAAGRIPPPTTTTTTHPPGNQPCAEGGGGGAGQILFGLAAMIAAAAPMVAASIQSKSDQKIAQINANTAITNANTQSTLQKYSIDQQTGLAKFNTQATEKIADEKNKKEMTQLQLQLQELASSRQQQSDLEREKRSIEQANLDQELNLKEQQALQTIQLAQQQRLTQEVAQGLSTGLQNVRDAGSRLQVNQVPITGGIGINANSQLARRSTTALSANQANAAGAGTGAGITNAFGSAFKSVAAINSTVGVSTEKPNLKAAKALITSATQPANSVSVISRGIASVNRLVKPPFRGLAQLGQGSSRGFKQVIQVDENDLNNPLLPKTKLNNNGILKNYNQQEIAVPVTSNHTQSANSQGFYSYSRGIRGGSVAYGQ